MSRRGGKQRTALETEAAYEKETRLYLQGYTQAQIAKAVGLTQPQVSIDLAVVKMRLVTQSAGNLEQWREEELARTYLWEYEAWREWEKSKRPKSSSGKKSVDSGDDSREEEWERKDGQRGDPRYLERIQAASEYRARLRGLEAPHRTELSGPDRKPIAVSGDSRQLVLQIEKRFDEASPAEQEHIVALYEDFTSALGNLAPLLTGDEGEGQ